MLVSGLKASKVPYLSGLPAKKAQETPLQIRSWVDQAGGLLIVIPVLGLARPVQNKYFNYTYFSPLTEANPHPLTEVTRTVTQPDNRGQRGG